MTYGQFRDFSENYMPNRMQHIYLPLVIGKLVEADSDKPQNPYHLADGKMILDKAAAIPTVSKRHGHKRKLSSLRLCPTDEKILRQPL